MRSLPLAPQVAQVACSGLAAELEQPGVADGAEALVADVGGFPDRFPERFGHMAA